MMGSGRSRNSNVVRAVVRRASAFWGALRVRKVAFLLWVAAAMAVAVGGVLLVRFLAETKTPPPVAARAVLTGGSQISTTTTEMASDDTITYGHGVTFSATVSPTDGGGSFDFFLDGSSTPINGCANVPLSGFSSQGKLLGEQPEDEEEGGASCQTESIPAGVHSVTATYSGDTDYATSSDSVDPMTVNPAPLMITASDGTMSYQGSPPTITPSYAGFELGDTSASLTTEPTCTTDATSSSPAGDGYTSSCSGAADPNYTISYTDGSVTVEPATTSFAITIDGSSSETVPFGTVTTLAESGLPSGATGTVTFQSGSTTLCSFDYSGSTTSCPTSSTLPVATYSGIAGTFSDTDGNYADSSSTNTVSLTVTTASSTTTVGTSASPSTYGQPVTFAAQVSPIDGGGTIAFTADGSSTIAGCGAVPLTLVSGTTYEALCTDSTLTAGTHSISATYSGDSFYDQSTGELSPDQSVTPASTSFSVSVNSTSSASIPVRHDRHIGRVGPTHRGDRHGDLRLRVDHAVLVLVALDQLHDTSNAPRRRLLSVLGHLHRHRRELLGLHLDQLDHSRRHCGQLDHDRRHIGQPVHLRPERDLHRHGLADRRGGHRGLLRRRVAQPDQRMQRSVAEPGLEHDVPGKLSDIDSQRRYPFDHRRLHR